MRLDNDKQIEDVAKRVNFSIFELPAGTDFSKIFEKSYHVTPSGAANDIKIDAIREVNRITANQQATALFIVVEQAERMNVNAANAFLKSLEEPQQNVHYVFLTNNSGTILPTIRSRANNYYIAKDSKVSDPPAADMEIFKLAKEYVSATGNQLPDIAEKIIKFKKDEARQTALAVTACGIELMYKSYLLRGNPRFLAKLEKLLETQAALSQNGHVKLQLIANML